MTKGFLAGMIAGLAASWAMNQFWAVQSKLQQQSQRRDKDGENQQEQHAPENPTVKVAQAITRPLLQRELTKDEKSKAGMVVHYAFGALMGGLYGLICEAKPAAHAGFGTVYAAALWLAGDEVAVPALKLSKPPSEYPLSQHLSGLGAHLVYGVTAEAARRSLRAA
jgi:putative membrane protein